MALSVAIECTYVVLVLLHHCRLPLTQNGEREAFWSPDVRRVLPLVLRLEADYVCCHLIRRIKGDCRRVNYSQPCALWEMSCVHSTIGGYAYCIALQDMIGKYDAIMSALNLLQYLLMHDAEDNKVCQQAHWTSHANKASHGRVLLATLPFWPRH
jgi:hypothetical protein